jgi:hypothetical protein
MQQGGKDDNAIDIPKHDQNWLQDNERRTFIPSF